MSDDQYRPHLTVVPPATLPTNAGPEVEGLDQATPDPALQTVPIARTEGETFLTPGWPTNDAPEMGDDYGRTAPITAHPVPIIGAIPYGSTVMSVGQATLAVGQAVTVGPQGSVQPQVTQLLLVVAGNELDIVGSADVLSRGLPLPVSTTPVQLNAQQLVVKNNSAGVATLSWLVLGYSVPQP